MRGKPLFSALGGNNSRITPADAGKTHAQRPTLATPQDHPRGCGENHKSECLASPMSGSPPRMRGKHFALGTLDCAKRITPADAGKTTLRRLMRQSPQDHPRGCGENSTVCADMLVSSGSPPRMRGKHGFHTCAHLVRGITPADAGKTRLIGMPFCQLWDHPRGCGENHIQRKLSVCKQGSPPRMRGKLDNPTLRQGTVRITPADAGKTKRLSPHPAWRQDHPRGCGENAMSAPPGLVFVGSPPRMRGKLSRS